MQQTASDTVNKMLAASKVANLVNEQGINIVFTDLNKPSYVVETNTLSIPFVMAMEHQECMTLFVFFEVMKIRFGQRPDGSRFVPESESMKVVYDMFCMNKIESMYPKAHNDILNANKRLLSLGWFGDAHAMKKMNMSGFLNRLSIYSKLGSIASAHIVTFTLEESEFIIDIEECSTVAELNAVVDKIDMYVATNDFSVSRKRVIEYFDRQSEFEVYEYTGDADDGYGNSASFDEGSDPYFVTGFQPSVDQYDAITEDCLSTVIDNFYQKKYDGNLVDYRTEFVTYVQREPDVVRILEVKDVIKYVDGGLGFNSIQIDNMREIRNDMSKLVDGMVSEFEMRKNAFRHKHAKRFNTGKLNMNRLSMHSLADDIFLKKTKLANAKNHGYIILLDCSSSIASEYSAMVDQVILLTEFWRRIGVKFRVFGYGAVIPDGMITNCDYFNVTYDMPSYITGENNHLIEFVNDSLTSNEHTKACLVMKNRLCFGLGDTPTLNAMEQMHYVATEFFAKSNTEINKIINITDGAPNGVARKYQTYRNSVIVIDSDKHYMIPSGNTQYQICSLIGKIFKDRYDIELVTIAVMSRFDYSHTVKFTHNFDKRSKSDVKRQNFAEMTMYYGDTLYLAKPINSANMHEEYNINERMTVGQATKEIVSKFKATKKMQPFLNALTKKIAEF